MIYFANIRRALLFWGSFLLGSWTIALDHGIYPDDNNSDEDDVEDVRKCESYLACALDADMLRGPIPLQALSLLLA